jgi:hypothetical protein
LDPGDQLQFFDTADDPKLSSFYYGGEPARDLHGLVNMGNVRLMESRRLIQMCEGYCMLSRKKHPRGCVSRQHLWNRFSSGLEECADAAEVLLKKDGREVGRATTDSFGEFKIDKLEPNSSGYLLEVTGSSGRFSTQFDLGNESRYLGVMTLAAT